MAEQSTGMAHGRPRDRVRSCGFEASETIPFPGSDSIFSSRCGAISRRLRFAVTPSRPAVTATETMIGTSVLGTHIEQLRNFGKKFVERLSSLVPRVVNNFVAAAVAQFEIPWSNRSSP
jgi:hypothetical protein